MKKPAVCTRDVNGFFARAKDGARRADALQATPPLGPEASRALLEVVGRVSLTEKRRTELAALAEKAQEAFNRPWPERERQTQLILGNMRTRLTL
jgi:hypothetical protein